MRPIVKAVGLICILAHDYLIVKIENPKIVVNSIVISTEICYNKKIK